jgi:hypothetical protein
MGPLGAVLFGNAREKIHDGRELYLVLSDPAWSIVIPVHPDLGQETRAFAQAIGRVATSLGPTAPAASQRDDLFDQLEHLGRLRDSGILTEEEFSTQKAGLLER